MKRTGFFGALAFGLWGVLHMVGAGAIWAALVQGGPGGGYAIYGHDGSALPAATGGILGYFAWYLACAGAAAAVIAWVWNRRNSDAGLAANTALIASVEIGVAIFLILPGHLSLAQASPGLVLGVAGIILGGIACRGGTAHAT